ncbi:unnamed protein product [Camellia sinensis]
MMAVSSQEDRKLLLLLLPFVMILSNTRHCRYQGQFWYITSWLLYALVLFPSSRLSQCNATDVSTRAGKGFWNFDCRSLYS